MMIDIGGTLINPAHVVSASIETRHYVNGSSSRLVLTMSQGGQLTRDHGYGFDAFATLQKIQEAQR